MTADELASLIGVSRPWLFHLKNKFPKDCPSNFNDVEGWKVFLASTRKAARVKRTPGAKTRKGSDQLSDMARLTKSRANKVETEHEILTIELSATRRQVVRQEEVIDLFAKVAAVARGRLMKMRNDLPSALLGLDAPAIDKGLGEKRG